MKLETERLILRETELNDFIELAKNLNNLNISKWITKMPYPYTEEDAKWWLEKNEEKKKEKFRKDYHFRILLKETREAIGTVGIFGFDEDKVKGEIGYWLAEPHWKKGYMKEAVKEIIRYGFEKLELKKIFIPCFVGNLGSNALAKSLGFQLEGTLRRHSHCMATGKIHDENIYGLLREEWKK